MILFWIICAAMVIVALAFVLPPLLQSSTDTQAAHEVDRRDANIAIYRDQLSELDNDLQNGIVSQQQYDQDREEIQRRLLEDVKQAESAKATTSVKKSGLVYVLAVGLPIAAVAFYLKVGDSKGISPIPPTASVPTVIAGERSQQQIEENVAALAQRLKSNPSDAEGWVMLARSYSSLEKFGEASGAYAKATELRPNNADLWAEYAFSSAMANGKQLDGLPMELVNKALKIDPDNLKALQLAGSAAFYRKDYKQAVQYWERVLKGVPPGSDVAQSIQSRIDEAKSLGNQNATQK